MVLTLVSILTSSLEVFAAHEVTAPVGLPTGSLYFPNLRIDLTLLWWGDFFLLAIAILHALLPRGNLALRQAGRYEGSERPCSLN